MTPTKKAITKSTTFQSGAKAKKPSVLKGLRKKSLELRSPKKGVRAKKNSMKPFKPASKVRL